MSRKRSRNGWAGVSIRPNNVAIMGMKTVDVVSVDVEIGLGRTGKTSGSKRVPLPQAAPNSESTLDT